MFTCPERVIRDGKLVCFAGQVMSEEEAEALGLAGAPASTEAPAAPKEPTAAEIKAELEALGVSYDKKAKKADLKELLAEAGAPPPRRAIRATMTPPTMSLAPKKRPATGETSSHARHAGRDGAHRERREGVAGA